MRDNIRVMRRNTCVYKIPEWVDIKKVETKEDFKAYCGIYLAAFGNSLGRRWKLWLNKKHLYARSYVWLYANEYVGIYTLREEESLRVTPNINFQVLYNFAIVPKMQGLGMAKVMLAAAITEVAKQGNSEVLLEVRLDNIKAVNLYKQFGFQFTNELDEMNSVVADSLCK